MQLGDFFTATFLSGKYEGLPYPKEKRVKGVAVP